MRGLPGIFAECCVAPYIAVKFDKDLDILWQGIALHKFLFDRENSSLLGVLKYPEMEIAPQRVSNESKRTNQSFVRLLLL